MTPWVLLFFSLISGYITFETLGLMDFFRKHPKALFIWILGKRGESQYNQSPNELKQYTLDRVNLKLAIFCIGVTLFFVNATFKAFTS